MSLPHQSGIGCAGVQHVAQRLWLRGQVVSLTLLSRFATVFTGSRFSRAQSANLYSANET